MQIAYLSSEDIQIAKRGQIKHCKAEGDILRNIYIYIYIYIYIAVPFMLNM